MQLAAAMTDGRLARSVLKHAAVLTADGQITPEAVVRLSQAGVLLKAAADDSWDLVLTVPGFLRTALNALVAEYGDSVRPRETGQIIREVAASATGKLFIGAPFLHEDFVRTLTRDVERVLTGAGEVVVVTRALSLSSPGRSSDNVSAVVTLREAAARAGRPLTVRSWEESGLGVHFKIALAYGVCGYLGSANPTTGGISAHAEAGVLLRGPGLKAIELWLDAVCASLAIRALPHA